MYQRFVLERLSERLKIAFFRLRTSDFASSSSHSTRASSMGLQLLSKVEKRMIRSAFSQIKADSSRKKRAVLTLRNIANSKLLPFFLRLTQRPKGAQVLSEYSQNFALVSAAVAAKATRGTASAEALCEAKAEFFREELEHRWKSKVFIAFKAALNEDTDKRLLMSLKRRCDGVVKKLNLLENGGTSQPKLSSRAKSERSFSYNITEEQLPFVYMEYMEAENRKLLYDLYRQND